MKKYIIFMFVSVVILAGCKDFEPDVQVSDSNQVFSSEEILEKEGYSIFSDAVAHASVEADLFGDDVTIFAPSNEAFQAMLAELGFTSITEIAAADLADILRYHAISGRITTADSIGTYATLLAGKSLYISDAIDEEGAVENTGINGIATIIDGDNFTTTGLIHGISRVLEKPADNLLSLISGSANHSTLSGLLTRVGLDGTLSNASDFTIFAPSDDAFTNAGLDAATLAAMPDQEVTDLLSFHLFAGRHYTVEVLGRLASVLGTTADDNVQEVEFADRLPNGSVLDSVNFSANNGVVHFTAEIIFTAFENSDFIPADFTALIDQVGANATYDNLDTLYSFVALDAGAPAVGTFANDIAIQDWLDTYTFEGSQAFRDMPSGTKIESGNGSKFYLQHTDDGDFTINGEGFLSTASTGTYNGYRNRFFTGTYPIPLPEGTITEVLAADSDYDLIAAAIVAAGMDDLVDAEGTTFYTIENAVFTATYGYALVSQIEALTEEEALGEFETLIDAHTVAGVISSLIINADTQIQTNAAGEEILWGNVLFEDPDDLGMFIEELSVILDVQDPSNSFLRWDQDESDIWTSNGVIHVLSGTIDD